MTQSCAADGMDRELSELECVGCGRPGWLPEAIEEGWFPDVYGPHDDEPLGEVCPECARRCILDISAGELVLFPLQLTYQAGDER